MSHSRFGMNLFNGIAFFFIPPWTSPPLTEWAFLDWRRDCCTAGIVLEGGKLGWDGLGERLGSGAEGIGKILVLLRTLVGGATVPSATKLISWSQVGCLLAHFLYLMPAYSHQCSLCLSLTVQALLGTAQRTQCSSSRAPTWAPMSNCSCPINHTEMTEQFLGFIWFAKGEIRWDLPLIITCEWLPVTVEMLSCALHILFPMLRTPLLPATPTKHLPVHPHVFTDHLLLWARPY